jgi:hypothetical protein
MATTPPTVLPVDAVPLLFHEDYDRGASTDEITRSGGAVAASACAHELAVDDVEWITRYPCGFVPPVVACHASGDYEKGA